jgi:PAS domain S-box-containing protein
MVAPPQHRLGAPLGTFVRPPLEIAEAPKVRPPVKALHQTRQVFALRIFAAAVVLVGAAALGGSALHIPVWPLVGFVALALAAFGVLFLGEAARQRETTGRALQESEERFHALADHSIQGILLIHDGRIVYANPAYCAMMGFSAEEIVSKTMPQLQALIHPEDRAQAVERQGRFERGEPINEVNELRIRNKDGSWTWVLAATKSFAILGKAARLGMIVDITRRKEAEQKVLQLNQELERRVNERTEQLESANRELEAFSYSISHDLRAPVRSMDGFAQAVVDDFGPLLPDDGKRMLLAIRRSANHMGDLIDDLLTFSRLSRQSLQKQTVNTDRMVQGTLEELGAPWPNRKVELRLAELPPCEADPVLLKQVWTNLLSNALKYTGKRDRALLEIGCRNQASRPVYFVHDNGTGFDMRYAHKLFGVFQRLHRADEYEGTGVGLAIVQRIIRRHGGRVWAEAAVDQGSTFFFTLNGETEL